MPTRESSAIVEGGEPGPLECGIPVEVERAVVDARL
jgi:hypothetical protein